MMKKVGKPFENVGKIVRILSEKFGNSWNKSGKFAGNIEGKLTEKVGKF